jgi:endonuclease/exonuclease/phosphatase family metal-dependent hydrolase
MEESAAAYSSVLITHPWGPIIVNRRASVERRLLKVVAFNARSGRSLDQISARLRRPPLSYPDIILLSEMDWYMRRSGRRETVRELAAELRMSFAYIGEFAVPPKEGRPVSFSGNAILSKWPLTDVLVLPVGKKSLRHRRVRRFLGAPAGLAAKVILNRRQLTLGVVHLSSRWNPNGRDWQIRQYLEGFPTGAAIIGGDLNTTTADLGSRASLIKVMALSLLQSQRFRDPQRWEPLFERLHDAGFDTTGANVDGIATFTPSRLVPSLVRPKLDWLALRSLKPIVGSAAVVPARTSFFSPRFSDHDFIMCTVET